MEKRNVATIMMGILILIFAIGMGIYQNVISKDELETDAMRFKREYEALNDTIRESDGEKYNNVNIPDDNPIVYIDSKEALDVLDEDNAILYVGASWCPWCRNAVPVLLDVAKKYEIEKIYYLDLDDEKSIWEIQDGKAVKTVDGTKYYYQLLELLSDHLLDYVLTTDAGVNLDTGEKRIYIPYVVGIKKGRIVGEHLDTVDLLEGQTKYDALNDDQYDELFSIYEDIFLKVYSDVEGSCSENSCD